MVSGFPCPEWVAAASEPLEDKFKEGAAEVAKRILGFLRNRVSAHLSRGGVRGDLVEAVLAAGDDTGWRDVIDARARLRALERLASSEETFEPLTTTFKRVSNIIRQAKEGGEHDAANSIDAGLLSDDAEKSLHGFLNKTSEAVDVALTNVRAGDAASLEEAYVSANTYIAEIRPMVDDFFDEVMVMAEDAALRKNRLALMAGVGALFSPIADFTKIRRVLSGSFSATAGVPTGRAEGVITNRETK